MDLLWVQTLIYFQHQSPQWCVQYHVILDRGIAVLDCMFCQCCRWFAAYVSIHCNVSVIMDYRLGISYIYGYFCPSLKPLNSSPTGQNDRHFADDIFKHIFLNEEVQILIKMSLKFIGKGSIDNMASIGSDNGSAPNRRRAIIWAYADPIHWRIYAALGWDEVTHLGLVTHTCVCEPSYYRSPGKWIIASTTSGHRWRSVDQIIKKPFA